MEEGWGWWWWKVRVGGGRVRGGGGKDSWKELRGQMRRCMLCVTCLSTDYEIHVYPRHVMSCRDKA